MRASIAGLVLLSAALTACNNSSDDPPIVNQAPTVSEIMGKTTVANGTSEPISFEVSDEDIPGVQLSAISGNTALLADESIVIAGNGSSRTLTATPVTDMTGDTLVTVVAVDADGLMDSASFLLTVVAEEKSMQQFAREAFADPADDEPALINAVDFAQDADGDEFTDLLAD